jgi:hypothetical protein
LRANRASKQPGRDRPVFAGRPRGSGLLSSEGSGSDAELFDGHRGLWDEQKAAPIRRSVQPSEYAHLKPQRTLRASRVDLKVIFTKPLAAVRVKA